MNSVCSYDPDSKANPIQSLTPYLLMNPFNIDLSSTSTSRKCPSSFRFSGQNVAIRHLILPFIILVSRTAQPPQLSVPAAHSLQATY